ncbi:uncharacterized protein LOC122951028 [Acropora millepora]|uniref:uncharacterized protein LOC122951028 n=1 Tax=Acropora millepora TaxID=45264 RepID=UPI001CF3B13F|nr:uncharacterized protein LOC122951028 [Acropora millepora]
MSFLLWIVFLLLLQSSLAAENPIHEGEIGSSDGGNVLLRSFTISEDFRNKDATIEVHLTSIDLLLSVKVDSSNRINSVSTIYIPEKPKMKKSEMTNPQELKSNAPLEEEPSVLTESTENCSSWFERAYTSFLTAAESLLKWLYIGIAWPRDINQGMFTLRTVTKFDQQPVNDVS